MQVSSKQDQKTPEGSEDQSFLSINSGISLHISKLIQVVCGRLMEISISDTLRGTYVATYAQDS